jgi:hypothetical protein
VVIGTYRHSLHERAWEFLVLAPPGQVRITAITVIGAVDATVCPNVVPFRVRPAKSNGMDVWMHFAAAAARLSTVWDSTLPARATVRGKDQVPPGISIIRASNYCVLIDGMINKVYA